MESQESFLLVMNWQGEEDPSCLCRWHPYDMDDSVLWDKWHYGFEMRSVILADLVGGLENPMCLVQFGGKLEACRWLVQNWGIRWVGYGVIPIWVGDRLIDGKGNVFSAIPSGRLA